MPTKIGSQKCFIHNLLTTSSDITFECGLTMISIHPIVNAKLQKEEGFPNISYRCNIISFFYRIRDYDKEK